MAPDITPEDVSSPRFRTVFRGYDPAEVMAELETLTADLARLQEERDRLAALTGDVTERDLDSEFAIVGRDVTAVLQTARQGADAMRERASLDAATWRAEAMSEVETMRNDASNDAEALRGDAWAVGSELLNQSAAEARRIRANAERDVLSTMGEAEREAHRLISAARREAEETLRTANMGAEKLSSEAKKRHDDLIDQAYRQSEAAQERTRALEERREELMEELETVRSTLSRLEGSLEERQDSFSQPPSDMASVRVVQPPKAEPDLASWQLGETVRIVPPEPEPGRREEPQPRSSVRDRDEPEAVPSEPPDEPSRQVAPEDGPELRSSDRSPTPEPVSVAEPEPNQPVQPTSERAVDPVGALFASLRGEATPGVAPAKEVAPDRTTSHEVAPREKVVEQRAAELSDRTDMIEMRDSRLLPITNRALRGVKKAVTDAQNLALDSLRTDESWAPSGAGLTDLMRADLIALWSESYSAGHSAAEEMVGSKLKRPATPHSDASEVFGRDLATAVGAALGDAGNGQRERQSATSRVFRAWRTDEAERRVRHLALGAFHRGLKDSTPLASLAWVASGTPCSACAEASNAAASHLPPVHMGCECTVVVT
jgi:DivIVA domain-containing protein